MAGPGQSGGTAGPGRPGRSGEPGRVHDFARVTVTVTQSQLDRAAASPAAGPRRAAECPTRRDCHSDRHGNCQPHEPVTQSRESEPD